MSLPLKSPLLIDALKVLSANSPETKFNHAVTEQGEVLQAFWYSERSDKIAVCFARSEGGWYFAKDDDAGLLNIQLHADGRISVMPPAGDAIYASGVIRNVEDLVVLLRTLRALEERNVAGVEINKQPLTHILT